MSNQQFSLLFSSVTFCDAYFCSIKFLAYCCLSASFSSSNNTNNNTTIINIDAVLGVNFWLFSILYFSWQSPKIDFLLSKCFRKPTTRTTQKNECKTKNKNFIPLSHFGIVAGVGWYWRRSLFVVPGFLTSFRGSCCHWAYISFWLTSTLCL